MKRTLLLIASITALILAGCATTGKADYSKFREVNPRSLLVVPVVNRSVDVDAPDYFLATITKPLAERGYYVYPVNLVKRTMEDEGLYDANLVHGTDAARVAKLFVADAVLFVTIERWDAKYFVLSTTVTVEFTYVLKSGKTGEDLWKATERMEYQPKNSSSGNIIADLVVSAVSAAVTKAKPNYLPLTQQANAQVLITPHLGLPAGPCHKNYLKDEKSF